jgi:uncharacterized protein YjgD (DUF1641 family)
MAKPITLDRPTYDPRTELQSRLQAAPAEHAEAVLAALDVLQGLHDRGVLELMRGALGSSDKVLEIAVDAANSPGSIRSIRNLLLAVNLLGAIDPETLKIFTQAAPQGLKLMAQQSEPPSLWAIMKAFLWNRNIRRGLGALSVMLDAFGGSLARKSEHG